MRRWLGQCTLCTVHSVHFCCNDNEQPSFLPLRLCHLLLLPSLTFFMCCNQSGISLRPQRKHHGGFFPAAKMYSQQSCLWSCYSLLGLNCITTQWNVHPLRAWGEACAVRQELFESWGSYQHRAQGVVPHVWQKGFFQRTQIFAIPLTNRPAMQVICTWQSLAK